VDVRLFGTKNFGFFEIYDVFPRTRGLRQCGHFADKEGGDQFSDFFAGVLYRRPLTLSRNHVLIKPAITTKSAWNGV